MTSRRAATATPTTTPSRVPGFRPSSRSQARIAVGTLLATGAVAVMLLIFATADKRVPVLQLVHDVPAGQQLVAEDVRTIEVSADPTLAVVHSSDLAVVVGAYARVRMISGALLARPMLQSSPLVAAGSAVVAITVGSGELPIGLRERSHVELVFPVAASQSADTPALPPVEGRVVGLPTAPDSVSGKLSLSIEVAEVDSIVVARAATVRVVLLDPGVDAATVLITAPDPAAWCVADHDGRRMSVVAVVGDGASTTAVGLAAAWPAGERVVLAELDAGGGCLSAWLDVPRSPSLSELVASSEAGSWPAIEATFQTSVSGIDVLVAPTRAVEAAAAIDAATATVLPVLAALDEPIVLADGGRLRGRLTALVAAAGVVAVMHRQHAGSASAATVGLERVADLCEMLSLRSIPFVVGLIGERPYQADEVADFVGADLVVPIAIDDWSAAVFAGRAGSARRLRRSPLSRSLGSLAHVLSTLLRETREELAAHDVVAGGAARSAPSAGTNADAGSGTGTGHPIRHPMEPGDG